MDDAPGADRDSESETLFQFGDYDVLEEIAHGGMGIIYRARQRRLDRTVAIKMVNPSGLRSSAARMRFQVEAGAIARLSHPNIVSLFESGERDGQLFYTMRYVSGGTLAARLSPVPADVRSAVMLLAQVARAVHFAHINGVLHRDIKPSNILIDDGGVPQLADFGLAKLEESGWDLTRSETVMGSPNYMAPEQAIQGAAVTTAADVYGLGAILYQILTGVPPFQAPTPVETMRQVIDAEPTPPHQLGSRNADLERVALRCLEKLPQHRYRSAAAFADELDRWLSGVPVMARPISSLGRLWRWIRREPMLAGAAGVMILLLVGIAAVSTTAYYEVRDAGEQTRLATETTALQLYRAQLREADLLFERGHAGEGMAILARLARNYPDDEVLQRRLANCLRYRPIPKLAAPYQELGNQEVLDHIVLDNGGTWVASRSGRVVELGEGRQTRNRVVYQGESAWRLAAIARGSLDTTAVTEANEIVFVSAAGERRQFDLEAEGNVSHLQMSPDGRYVAAVIAYQRLVVIEVGSGRRQALTADAGTGFNALAFNSQSSLLGVALTRGGGIVLPPDNLAAKELLPESGHSYHAVVFSDNNEVIGFASPSGPVGFWRLRDGRRIDDRQWQHAIRANGLCLSADGRRAVTYGAEGMAYVWDLEAGKRLRGIPHFDYISSAQLSPDGARLVTASHDRVARVWDVETGRALSDPMYHTAGIIRVDFGVDETDVRSACYDGTVWHWAAQGPAKPPQIYRLGTGPTASTSYVAGRQALVAAEQYGGGWGLRIVDPNSGLPGRVRFVSDSVNQIVLNRDSSLYAFRSGDRVEVFESETDRRVGEPIEFATGGITDLAFSPIENRLVIASRWHPVRNVLVEKDSWQLSELPVDRVDKVSISADGKYLALSETSGRCGLWEALSGKWVMEMGRGPKAEVFSPDGRFVVLVGGEQAYLFDLERGTWFPGLMIHNSQIRTVAFSPDSQWVMTGSMDHTGQIWRIGEENLELQSQLRHSGVVNAIAVDATGSILATGTEDARVRLWDLESGYPLCEWLDQAGPVQALLFGSAGAWLGVISGTGHYARWELADAGERGGPWLPDLVEYLARRRLDAQGRALALNRDSIGVLEQRLRVHQLRYPDAAILNEFGSVWDMREEGAE